LRSLQRFFPQIKRSQFKNKSCYYLEDKNNLALLELIKQDTTRIISYQDLSNAAKIFNANIEIQEKRAYLGRNRWRRAKKIQKSTNKYSTVPKEKQSILDDFFGRFLHSEVLQGYCVT